MNSLVDSQLYPHQFILNTSIENFMERDAKMVREAIYCVKTPGCKAYLLLFLDARLSICLGVNCYLA